MLQQQPGHTTPDGAATDQGNASKVHDLSGGWFDAGDMNKYVTFAVIPVHQSVERYVGGEVGRGNRGAPATIIVDPPRTGLSRDALRGVVECEPSRVIYVSCDVATLARDARAIVDSGYAITRADAFDLFPNTPHVETVVVFDRWSA